MTRDKQHFFQRLTKETYTKEEIAELLHNEANFTTEKVSKDNKKKNQIFKDELKELKTKLEAYDLEKKDNNLLQKFKDMGGNTDKFETFKKLHGDKEEIDFDEAFKELPSLKKESFTGSNLTHIAIPFEEEVPKEKKVYSNGVTSDELEEQYNKMKINK